MVLAVGVGLSKFITVLVQRSTASKAYVKGLSSPALEEGVRVKVCGRI